MSKGLKIVLGVLIVAVLAATVGCSKLLDKFREKHPDPPPGAFPPRVGKMVLEESEHKNPNCTRADPLHCWGYYVVPGGDNETTRIHYYMQIYDSPDEANARLEEYFSVRSTFHEEDIHWEDRLNKEGQKVGKQLLKNSVRHEEDGIYGFCSVSYTRAAMFITITHGYECGPAREFLKDLTAITD